MAGREWTWGDVVGVDPDEVTEFEALTDVTNVVVQTPGALNDRFVYVEDETDEVVKLF